MTDNNAISQYKIAFAQMLRAEQRGADIDSIAPFKVAVAAARGKIPTLEATKAEDEVREALAKENPGLYGNVRG